MTRLVTDLTVVLDVDTSREVHWIDSTNAFNTTCRQLIKEAVTLFLLNIVASCYEIKIKFIIRTG